MLMAGRKSGDASKKSGGLIEQLKSDLNKQSGGAGVGNLLDKSAGPGAKRPNLPFGGQQRGHNQTFGADVNRAGVPRRTGG